MCRHCPQELLCRSYQARYPEPDAGRLRKTRPTLMSFEMFKVCIDKVPRNVDIHFSGMCEPWLNENCTKMLLYANERGHKTYVFTTLVGMTEEDYEAICHTSPEMLFLHIPDADGNSAFCCDDAYLRLLRRALNDHSRGIVRVRGLSCHGVVHPAVREMVHASGIPVNCTLHDRAGNVNEQCDISIEAPLEGSVFCRWCRGDALDKNVLLPDGTVLMCCMDYGANYSLGNLYAQSYQEISEGSLKKSYRMRLKNEKYGEILCRKCFRAAPHIAEKNLAAP